MTKNEIKSKLIAAGVKNLKELGYPSVDGRNILLQKINYDIHRNSKEANRAS